MLFFGYQESLPPEYARIFAFDNFARTQKHVLSKALEMEQEESENCISANSYARLHIKEVPEGIASKLCLLAKERPVTACGLLQHESKMSVLHFRYFYCGLFLFLFVPLPYNCKRSHKLDHLCFAA